MGMDRHQKIKLQGKSLKQKSAFRPGSELQGQRHKQVSGDEIGARNDVVSSSQSNLYSTEIQVLDLQVEHLSPSPCGKIIDSIRREVQIYPNRAPGSTGH